MKILIVAALLAASPCPTWVSWLIEWDNPFCPVHKTAAIIEHAGVSEGMTVLDAGCGPGRVTVPLSIKVGPEGTVIALDIQEGMLEKAQEKVAKANLENVHFLQAGLGENRLGKDFLDRAIMVCVLGETPDREAALREIFEALKPGGVLSITEIIFDPDYLRYSTVLELADQAGFEEKEYFGSWPAYTLNLQKPQISL